MGMSYTYQGPRELLKLDTPEDLTLIRKKEDVLVWMQNRTDAIATFILNLEGQLWIATRNAEHVACARGKNVLSAGEIVFARMSATAWIESVTN